MDLMDLMDIGDAPSSVMRYSLVGPSSGQQTVIGRACVMARLLET